jgi:hypothetical protein
MLFPGFLKGRVGGFTVAGNYGAANLMLFTRL